jgi:hypothetical protein
MPVGRRIGHHLRVGGDDESGFDVSEEMQSQPSTRRAARRQLDDALKRAFRATERRGPVDVTFSGSKRGLARVKRLASRRGLELVATRPSNDGLVLTFDRT